MHNERLVALSGNHEGAVCEVQGTITIGRNPENTLQIDDLQVSRKHAVIERTPRGTLLRDLGSGNGTYVGNLRVIEHKLGDGDVVRFGLQEYRFESEEAGDLSIRVEQKPGTGVRFRSGDEGNFEAKDANNLYQTMFNAPPPAATEDQLRATQKRLQAVYAANQIITSERDLGTTFEKVMDQIFGLVPAHNGVIMLQGPKGDLVTEFVKSGDNGDDVTISSSIVNRAFEKGEAVITYDAAGDARFGSGVSIISQNISSAMCVPLAHQDECLGVVYVDTRGTTNAFVSSDLELLVALAGPAAIAIKNAQYVRMLESAYNDTLVVLASAIELRDHYTVGHTWRVTNFSMAIARELGWDEAKLKEVRMGGVLHDVGKIAVDDAILRKPTRLTPDEFAKMKIHPERGADLLREVAFLQPLIPYCLYHHERYDGKGYPFGLRGEDIPIEGRIVAVADTLDAMTSNRPYRKGLDPEIALAEIERGKGTQFDSACVDALIKAYREKKIDRILQDYYKTGHQSIACPFCSTFLKLGDEAEAGRQVECHVCHSRLLVREQNEVYYGERIQQGNPTPAPPAATPNPAQTSG